MIIVGSSVAIGRLLLDYPTLTGQALRYGTAAVLLLVIARFFPASRPTWKQWGILLLLGATGLAFFNVCILIGLRHAEPAVIGTVIGAAPLGLAILGPLLRGRRPTVVLSVAAVVVVAGTALVQGLGRTDGVGLACAAGGLAGEVAFSLLAAAVLPSLGAVRVAAYSCVTAVPVLLVGALVAGEVPRLPSFDESMALAYMAVLMTVVAFLAWFLGLQRLGVERAGILVGILPLATLATASIMDGKLPGPGPATGVVIVAVGLALPTLRSRPLFMIKGPSQS
jgi:drug/metabolite transporter (DMT)-like permease